MSSPERDRDLLAAGVRSVKARLGTEVTFGGLVKDNRLTISELVGARTRGLQDLEVHAGEGVGGRAMFEVRPVAVADYGRARSITHEHDEAVLGEGLTSVMAVPVLAYEKVRGMVYLGSRTSERIGEAAVRVLQPFIAGLEREIRIRDEVDRRVAVVEAATPTVTPSELTSLREVQAELRELAATIDDAGLAQRINDIGRRMSATTSARILTARELDVLSLVALGCSNAEIATRLQLGVETVRSYLKNAMHKLGASTRLEAVVSARRRGELL